jgi:hypothetical protein
VARKSRSSCHFFRGFDRLRLRKIEYYRRSFDRRSSSARVLRLPFAPVLRLLHRSHPPRAQADSRSEFFVMAESFASAGRIGSLRLPRRKLLRDLILRASSSWQRSAISSRACDRTAVETPRCGGFDCVDGGLTFVSAEDLLRRSPHVLDAFSLDVSFRFKIPE